MTPTSIQSADDFATRKVELVLQQLEHLPTLPAIAVRLLSLTGSNNTKIQEVVALLSADPALTAKVLSLVSSAAAGVRQPVTTVHQAVVLLGFDAIRNLALSVKVFEVFQQEPEANAGHFSRTEFWKHALAVASCAEMLAPLCQPRLSGPDAFVCGLLHDLGKVAFDAVMPKSFARVVEIATLTRGDIADVERRIIGLDHAMAGRRLAEAWNLPTMIVQSIWLHGVVPQSVPGGIINPNLARLVGLADLLARQQHIGFSGNYQMTSDLREYLEPLGLAAGEVARVISQLAEALETRARAIGLNQVQSRTLYLESIANANAELGRVNQMLAGHNRRLAQRSECFELLTRFYQRIAPAATPAQLLGEIGQVALAYLKVRRVVLFSQDPEQRAGEMVIVETRRSNGGGGSGGGSGGGTGMVRDSRMLTMPALGGDQRRGRSGMGGDFLRPARPQLDWLLENVTDWESGNRVAEGEWAGESKVVGAWRFMPLLCGELPVGGLLWQEVEAPRVVSEADLKMVSQAWGMTLRSAQEREQHNILTEALASSNRSLGALQQQLVRAKSLVSLGEMAAGAAHEMNNPLAVVCGRAQLLAGKLSDPALRQDAQQIAQQGERLSQIITDLMAFAKPAAPKLEPVVLTQLLTEAVAEARQRAGEVGQVIPIHLQRDDPGNQPLPTVKMDPVQIRSALAEIILNALQASTGESGASAGSPQSPEVFVQARIEVQEGQLIIQVIDHGRGMNPDTMRQAFSPFYSAKPAGRQRGMGLAKALRWVELHGGTIRLDSAPHSGTTVVILLPLAA